MTSSFPDFKNYPIPVFITHSPSWKCNKQWTSCFDCCFLFISFHRVAKKTLIHIYRYIERDREREEEMVPFHLPQLMGPAPSCCASLLTVDDNAAKYPQLPKNLTAQLFSYRLSIEESCHNKCSKIAVLSLLTQRCGPWAKLPSFMQGGKAKANHKPHGWLMHRKTAFPTKNKNLWYNSHEVCGTS